MQASLTEENYLKAIYILSGTAEGKLSNLSIADRLSINPATVTEMLRKLAEKKLIDYTRIEGARLTVEGTRLALMVVRKHRLWETFLVEKLQFGWDEVHEVAEQLEHIHSDKLLEQLDAFLGHPRFDPHGDPIPDTNGKMPETPSVPLSEGCAGTTYRLVGVSNHSPAFLRYLDKTGLSIDDVIEIKDIQEFDQSMQVVVGGEGTTMFSHDVAKCLLVLAVEGSQAADEQLLTLQPIARSTKSVCQLKQDTSRQ